VNSRSEVFWLHLASGERERREADLAVAIAFAASQCFACEKRRLNCIARSEMEKIGVWKILGQGVVALVVLLVLAGCGGSDAAASTAATSSSSASSGTAAGGSTTTSGSGSGSTGSGSSGGTGSSAPAATTKMLFQQPQVSSIDGHFVVPLANHVAPPKGSFALVAWQTNRFQSNGELVATAWDAGAMTGFTPAAPATAAQLGFQNEAGTSTAQMEGNTVGAYINSKDLPPSNAAQKMMITPQYIFAAGAQPSPFANPQSLLNGALELQVPTAVGSDVYIVADLLFQSPSGQRVSYGVAIFRNGRITPVPTTGYDAPSNSYMLNSPLGVDERFVTPTDDSAAASGTPWSGWRHFAWSISYAQFVSALQYLAAQYPGKVSSIDPSEYVLAEIHLNAEFHEQNTAAALGWSMQGMEIFTTTP
jgi:hypothetical protein